MRARSIVLVSSALAIAACEHAKNDRGDGAPVVDASAKVDAGAPANASGKVIGIEYSGQDPTGGVSVRVEEDGHVHVTFLNRGFSPRGAEVVPREKTIDAAEAQGIYRRATELSKANPPPEPTSSDWTATETLSLQSEGNVRRSFVWKKETTPHDPRVAELAKMMRGLAN